MINSNTMVVLRYPVQGEEDEYGNPTETLVDEVHEALIAWGATGTDYGVERNILTTQATLYFREPVQTPAGSEFLIAGERFVLDGEEVRWQAPAGFSLQTGSVVQIKKVVG